MNEWKDKALKRALKQQEETPHLPPNFCFRTMLRINEEVRLREKRTERRLLVGIIAVSLLLIGGGVFVLTYFYGDLLRQAFAILWESADAADFQPAFLLCLPVIILLYFDYLMRRTYYSHRHKKQK